MDTTLAERFLRYNQNLPRYTSYPTAPHFHDGITGETYHHWLAELPGGTPLSLYVHIPFCRQMCWYCGCHTRATRQYAPVEKYLGFLQREIKNLAVRLPHAGQVTHVHFGGGSPGILLPEDFEQLNQTLRQAFRFAPDADIAIELDPRHVSEARVAAYAMAGVNRASLGVQDFHRQTQQAIGRVQPFHTVYDSARLLQRYGITALNLDLLYGLPHQTTASMEENITLAMALAPSRLALFGYAHVPWMKKHMRLIPGEHLPDAAARLELFDVAAARLRDKGMRQTGLDHFVHPHDSMAISHQKGTLHRNFQGYTTDAAPVLVGLGVSSISQLPQGYAQNTLNMESYSNAIQQGQPPVARGIALGDDDRLRRDIIEQLMCYGCVDVAAVCAAHHQPVDNIQESLLRLAPLEADGLVLQQNGIVTVCDIPQSVRLVAAAFDTWMTCTGQRHSQVA